MSESKTVFHLTLSAMADSDALAQILWEGAESSEAIIDLIMALDGVIEDNDFSLEVIARLSDVVATSEAEEAADGVGTRTH